jgi:hypothetical protein
LRISHLSIALASFLSIAPLAHAADQTVPGAGNADAIKLAADSPLIGSGRRFLSQRIASIRNVNLHVLTLQAIEDPNYCIAHRASLADTDKDAIVIALTSAGLLDANEVAGFPGGARAGVFPPVLADGTKCPKLAQRFYSAPGSPGPGHHTYPGGLVVHESFNSMSFQSFADNYRRVFGRNAIDGSAQVDGLAATTGAGLDPDIAVAAPLWHDWAKAVNLQWNADGSEFRELHIAATGGHHIIGLAEAMKRGFAPDFVVTQASAHTSPNDNEGKVVNFLRAAAIIARVDPVAKGYLRMDGANALRLPVVRKLGDFDLNAAGKTNFLVEYTLHNLSDGDWILAEPAVDLAELVLSKLAGTYGYDPANAAIYVPKYRNVALTFLSAERIVMLYGNGGLAAVKKELDRLKAAHKI